jgi:NAD(P)H-dependent FMN reductase
MSSIASTPEGRPTREGAPRVLVFAGSTRTGSLNKRLARVAAAAVQAAGGEATLIDLAAHRMPLYDGDLEASEGVPAEARRLREMLKAHDALLVVSPENNSSVPAVLKNTLDWLSRPVDGQNGLVPFQGKVAALMAASPGALGGLRGLFHLRQILNSLQVLVIPEQFALPRAHEALPEAGGLADAKHHASVTGVARRLVEIAARIAVPAAEPR